MADFKKKKGESKEEGKRKRDNLCVCSGNVSEDWSNAVAEKPAQSTANKRREETHRRKPGTEVEIGVEKESR